MRFVCLSVTSLIVFSSAAFMSANITTSLKSKSHVTLTDISSAMSCNKGITLFKDGAKKKGEREKMEIKEVLGLHRIRIS